jgi:hypothetical protein
MLAGFDLRSLCLTVLARAVGRHRVGAQNVGQRLIVAAARWNSPMKDASSMNSAVGAFAVVESEQAAGRLDYQLAFV